MSESLNPEPELPEWLAQLPMDVPKRTLVPMGESGVHIPAEVLRGALDIEVGSGIGALAIAPELAQRVAEFTENPHWKNLALEPTMVTRKSDDTWEATVGETTITFGRESIIAALERAREDKQE